MIEWDIRKQEVSLRMFAACFLTLRSHSVLRGGPLSVAAKSVSTHVDVIFQFFFSLNLRKIKKKKSVSVSSFSGKNLFLYRNFRELSEYFLNAP